MVCHLDFNETPRILGNKIERKLNRYPQMPLGRKEEGSILGGLLNVLDGDGF